MKIAVTILLALYMPATGFAGQAILENVGFAGPEAARYDDLRDQYLVSNLGPGRGYANDGFVSRVSPKGQVVELKWIEGGRNGVSLYAPLGIYVTGDQVYVADRNAVRIFKRSTGDSLASFQIDDAVRLNDLAVADDGMIYVTDSGSRDAAGALYRISADGTVEVFAARDVGLQRPNGIALAIDGSVVHGGLQGNVLFFRDAIEGTVLRQRELPSGRIDGIVAMPNGDLLVASQDGHNVWRVPADGAAAVEVARDIQVPAAIGLDFRRNRLLVPQIAAETLTLIDLNK